MVAGATNRGERRRRGVGGMASRATTSRGGQRRQIAMTKTGRSGGTSASRHSACASSAASRARRERQEQTAPKQRQTPALLGSGVAGRRYQHRVASGSAKRWRQNGSRKYENGAHPLSASARSAAAAGSSVIIAGETQQHQHQHQHQRRLSNLKIWQQPLRRAGDDNDVIRGAWTACVFGGSALQRM